jgi:hypothetical protein
MLCRCHAETVCVEGGRKGLTKQGEHKQVYPSTNNVLLLLHTHIKCTATIHESVERGNGWFGVDSPFVAGQTTACHESRLIRIKLSDLLTNFFHHLFNNENGTGSGPHKNGHDLT